MAKILIVEARFYDHLNDMLVAGARAAIKAAGHQAEVITVPGALEIPGAISLADQSGEYDGYVAIGVVIRGETYHFEIVSDQSAAGIMRVQLDSGVPVANGVLTTETDAQAEERMHVKGAEAGRVAVEMANLLQAIEDERD